eukprot:1795589-Amphidinium_carterae.1
MHCWHSIQVAQMRAGPCVNHPGVCLIPEVTPWFQFVPYLPHWCPRAAHGTRMQLSSDPYVNL